MTSQPTHESLLPEGNAVPLVLDSPHSGSWYPPEFNFTCPLQALRQSEDAYVDELFAAAPEHGAVLQRALFPRTFIDVNRALTDIDPHLLAAPWPTPIQPSDKSRAGMGLIRRLCKPHLPVYDRLLQPSEIQQRIDTYYMPYHAALTAHIETLHQRFGTVWHLNCHSMPSTLLFGVQTQMPDIVLGDRDGTTAGQEMVAFVTEVLRGSGLKVAYNTPYKGVEIVRRYGQPSRGVHSLQIEINRGLYMHEETLVKKPEFHALKEKLTQLLARMAEQVNLIIKAN